MQALVVLVEEEVSTRVAINETKFIRPISMYPSSKIDTEHFVEVIRQVGYLGLNRWQFQLQPIVHWTHLTHRS